MRRAAIIIGIAWLALVVPGMVAGSLWSGGIPLWPPVRSGHINDRVIWAVLFGMSYGLPVVSAALLYFSGRMQRQKR